MAKRYYNGPKVPEHSKTDVVGNRKGMYARKDMMDEDRSAPSNCPMEVVSKEYPRLDYLDVNYDDSWQSMDASADEVVRSARKQLLTKKY